MNIFKYAIFRIKNETPALRKEASASASLWVKENMSHLPKLDDHRRVAFQSYMTAFISSRLRSDYQKSISKP